MPRWASGDGPNNWARVDCGVDGNFASRVVCRGCGKPAPRSVVDKAKVVAKAARTSGRAGGGAAATKTQAENAKLKKGLVALKKTKDAAGSGSDASDDGNDAEYLDGLELDKLRQ